MPPSLLRTAGRLTAGHSSSCHGNAQVYYIAGRPTSGRGARSAGRGGYRRAPAAPRAVEQEASAEPPKPTPTSQSFTFPAQSNGSSMKPAGVQRKLTAAEQLEVLRKAQAASQEQLQKANINPAIGADPNMPREFRGHTQVDVRMYDQLTASRNRISQNLSKANQYINVLEEQVEERDDRISLLHDEFGNVVSEINTLMKMGDRARAAALYGVEKEEAAQAIDVLMDRMVILQSAAAAHLEALDCWVVREVPVEYNGTGAEVRIMGSFDNWTFGHLLSSDGHGDGVYQTFRTHIRLVPGTYRVKFKVDGEWRTAGEWETVTDADGNLENLLVVE